MLLAEVSGPPTASASSSNPSAALNCNEFVDEPLANRCFETIESLDRAVGDCCVALTQQADMVRDGTLFRGWPQQQASK